MHTVRARTLRLIAMRLDGTGAGRGVLVAMVVDDISDVLRVGADMEREDRRFEQVLDAVDAMVWEADAEALLLLAVSKAAFGITGRRHVDLLGRVALGDLVAAVRAVGKAGPSRHASATDGGDRQITPELFQGLGAVEWAHHQLRPSTSAKDRYGTPLTWMKSGLVTSNGSLCLVFSPPLASMLSRLEILKRQPKASTRISSVGVLA